MARGQEYRLAWEDERDGGGGRIYGQRLSGAGELVLFVVLRGPLGSLAANAVALTSAAVAITVRPGDRLQVRYELQSLVP